jgi:pimeloyl-ACP methyl ester carboxylesterase
MSAQPRTLDADDARYGTTTLHLAATVGDADAVASLLAAGADCEASDGGGYTPLHCAAAYGRVPAANALLTSDRGEALLFACDVEGSSPLMLACWHGRTRCVEALVRFAAPSSAEWLFGSGQSGAADDVVAPVRETSTLADALEHQDQNGRTALHHAVQSGEIAIVRMLIRAALVCTPEALQEEDGDGETPLEVASGCGWGVVVDALIEAIVRPVYVVPSTDRGSGGGGGGSGASEPPRLRELYPSDRYTRYGDEHDQWLSLPSGAQLHYETWGDARCPAVICCHGGPGGGIDEAAHRLFAAGEFFVVTFDQRGCGSSMPSIATVFAEEAAAAAEVDAAGDDATEGGGGGATVAALRAMTTAALVDDIEALRQYLSIERWFVYGHAWGATLALAYATRHPMRTASLLLVSVQLGLGLAPHGAAAEAAREASADAALGAQVIDSSLAAAARRGAARELIQREIDRSFAPADVALAQECTAWLDDDEIILPWAAISVWFRRHDFFLEDFADVAAEVEGARHDAPKVGAGEEEGAGAGMGTGAGRRKGGEACVELRFAQRAAEVIALHDIDVALVHGACDRVANPLNTASLYALIAAAHAKLGSTAALTHRVAAGAGHSEQSPGLRHAVIELGDRLLLYFA